MNPFRFFSFVLSNALFTIAFISSVYASAGDVWIYPSSKTVNTNTYFDLEVRVNSGLKKLGAYSFTITYNISLLNVDTSKGTSGVDPGPDGFISAVNTNNAAGILSVNGFNVNGTGPGSSLRVLTIHFKSLFLFGTAPIGLSVSTLTDETGITIGTPSGTGGTVSVQNIHKQSIGVFRNGSWYLDYNGNGVWNGCSTDFCGMFGLPTDTPIVGDWDGDGWTEIGVKRGTYWYLDYNGNGIWDGCVIDRCYTFGLSTDIPVAGDWNNGGTDKIGVFRNGSWYLDANGNGIWNGCMTDICISSFGLSSDKPVAGDWNGDGYSEIGVFRNGMWYLDYDGSDSWSGCGIDKCYTFGLLTDTPIVGDWNGSGYTKIGVKRGTAWYLDYNGNGTWNGCTTDKCYNNFGLSADKPVAGRW